MDMVRVISLLALAHTVTFCAEGEAQDRVSVAVLHGVYGDKKNMHHDEFDAALDKLGWDAEKFASTTEEMDRLTANLRAYDMALVCPLFNFGQGDARVKMEGYGAAFRAFVEGGGALITTDALYPETLAWLMSIDPSLKLGAARCEAGGAIESTRPENAIRFVPNRVQENNIWGHLELPEEHGWEVVAQCSEGSPQAVMRRIGKGYVYVTGCRLGSPEFLENFIASLRLQRIGLDVTAFELPAFNIGTNEIKMTFSGRREINGEVTVIPFAKTDDASFGYSFRAARLASSPIKNNIDAKVDAKVDFDIEARGDVRIILDLYAKGWKEERARVFDRVIQIKPLLDITGPRYRGFAVTSDLKKRKGQILVTVTLNPYNEKLQNVTLNVNVADANGKSIGKAKAEPTETRFLLPVNIGTPKPGAYTITAELYWKGRLAETKAAPLTVLSDAECPVYIDDDMNIIAGGAPFFPIGIYHVSPDDLDQVASLGFNTVQMWSWFNERALTDPARHGLRVLYEQNHRGSGEEWIGERAKDIADKYPNLLFWYAIDEPSASAFEAAQRVNDVYHKWDNRHPTFMVSCTPPLFTSQVPLGDIFAVDPYPYPKNPVTMVSDWMDMAWAATAGDRPVICVPQAFGTETPEILRVMSYLGVVHEARGILWYPWDDGGTSGLKHHPALHGAMKQIVSEFTALSPALLNKDGRKQFKCADGKVHGLCCQEHPKKRYVLLANTEATGQSVDLRTLDALSGAKELKEAFGSGVLDLKGAAGTEVTLGPYEVRVYAW